MYLFSIAARVNYHKISGLKHQFIRVLQVHGPVDLADFSALGLTRLNQGVSRAAFLSGGSFRLLAGIRSF